jgi:predicted permease
MLASIGGVIALALGTWTLRTFVALVPPGTLPVEASPSLDGRALVFTMAACLITGVVAGVLPAWQAGRMTLTETLAASGRGFSAAPRTAWLQSALLVVELALAMVLVTGAALLAVSFNRLLAVPPGFSAADVLTFRVSIPPARYQSDGQVADFYARIQASLQALPSVQAAGAATSLPLGGWLFGTRFGIEGAAMDQERLPSAHIQHVTPGYFEALKIGLAAGRTFTAADDARGAQVVIVNETLARRFVPGGPALGRMLLLDTQATGRPTPQWEIVGVIRNVKTYGLADADDATPEIYVPHAQLPMPVLYFAVRAARGDASRLVPDIRAALRSVDPEVPLGNVMPMDDRLGVSVRLQRFRTATIATFAGLAALLACLGAYAVRSRAVAARAREMGIRVALGATRWQVIALALSQGVRLAALGLALGWVASYFLAGLVRQWLFDTRATDPLIAIVSVLLLGGAALAASWAPARRAASVDPLKVLRED